MLVQEKVLLIESSEILGQWLQAGLGNIYCFPNHGLLMWEYIFYFRKVDVGQSRRIVGKMRLQKCGCRPALEFSAIWIVAEC